MKDRAVINSLMDNDLYKFTMQQVVLHFYPHAVAEYRFVNRGRQRFRKSFLDELQRQVDLMANLEVSPTELHFLSKLPFIEPWYLSYLRSYRFNPAQVAMSLDMNNQLIVTIRGPWHEAILWEVPLMATISELYFSIIEAEWGDNPNWQRERAIEKRDKLAIAGCKFADFGTRRRRSCSVHLNTMKGLAGVSRLEFVGTSNVHLAYHFGVKPIGTMAHEWVQAISALESVNHANRYMMNKWAEFYRGNLGIALTDTYGLKAFLDDFSPLHAKLFDGVRHDSGCPYEFADRIVAAYKQLGVDPKSKTIVFSDGLNPDTAISINKYCEKIGIGCSFGIGTNFTNDFPGSPALNIVIKLWSINDMPVVKLSEDPSKAVGYTDTIQAVKTLYGIGKTI